MMKNLHPLMKRRTSWNYEKPLAGRSVWVSDLGTWSGSSNRVNRGLKPWVGVGGSWAEQRFIASIRSHMLVKKNSSWIGSHFRRKLVTIF